MSTTQTATVPTDASNSAPNLTVLTRMACIPIIASSLETIDGALSKNVYLRMPYSTAKGISTSAYEYSGPLRMRLEPIIFRADTYANKAVDMVESRYPYPFKARPEEMATYVRKNVTDTVNSANKSIDDNIRTPAINVAQGIDQRFSPIVDYFQVAVSRLSSPEAGPSTPPDAKYQYQRALALSRILKDNLYVYSNEQLKNLQTQSVLAQRATETAQSITGLASTSVTSAQARIHELSDNMLSQVQKLQMSTASFSASIQSIQSSVHDSATQLQHRLPPQVQQRYTELANNLSSAAAAMGNIIGTENITVQEKITRMTQEVRDRVTPLLETLKKGASELMARGKDTSAANSSNN